MKKKAITLCLCVMVGLLCFLPARADDSGTENTLTGTTKLEADTTYSETKTVSGTATLDLNGCTLTFSGTGSVFHVKNGGTLTITDSSSGKTGKITGGKALAATTPLTPTGSFGGGEFVNDNANGGGVYVADGGKLILTGGKITDNYATRGGGVYLESGASLEVSGSASVTGNYAGEESQQPSNVWLPLDSVITVVDTLDSGASIGVSLANAPTDDTPVVITSGLADKGVLASFTSDDAAYLTQLSDGGEAQLLYTPIAYTVTAVDKDENAEKYEYGESLTIAVAVSGENGESCEGAEFTLTYDAEMFALTEEKVAPLVQTPTGGVSPRNTKTNDTAGVYDFSLNNNITLSSGEPLVYLTFQVIQHVQEDTPCTFAFSGTPKVCYDLNKNTIAAWEAVDGRSIVTPTLYDVTLVPSSGELDPGSFTLTGDNAVPSVDNDKAIAGFDYAVAIAPYDTDNYAYQVDLKVDDTPVESENALRLGSDGKLTILESGIKGAVTLTVTRTLTHFTVEVVEDYVTDWTLVTVAKTDENHADPEPIYTYNREPMYYVDAYNAYAILIPGPDSGVAGGTVVTIADAERLIALGTETAGTIPAGDDVNATGQVDYSDALLTYRCYVLGYDLTDMETYLRADVDHNKHADTEDVAAINAGRRTAG